MAAPVKGKKSILEKMGIVKAPKEPSEGKKAAENRAMGETIAEELEAIDFYNCAYKGKTAEDSPEEMAKKTRVIIHELKNAPTICDNIKGMDEILLYAAQAFSEAIKNNDYNKAIWSKNALCRGVLYLRDNVPDDKTDVKEKVLEERLKFMKNYKAIIQEYEIVDAKEKTIYELDRAIKEAHKSYDPKVKEIDALTATPEGQKILGALELNQISPDKLNDEEKKITELARVAALEALNIHFMSCQMNKAQMELDTSMAQVRNFRTVLVNKPDVFNKDLTALHDLAIDEGAKQIAEAYAVASQVIDSVKKNEAKLSEIMNGADAQKAQQFAVSYIKKIIYGEENNDAEAIREGHRIAERANKARLEREQAAAEAAAEMNKIIHEVEDIDISGATHTDDNIDFSENADESADENKDENTSENGNSNVNYSYNS